MICACIWIGIPSTVDRICSVSLSTSMSPSLFKSLSSMGWCRYVLFLFWSLVVDLVDRAFMGALSCLSHVDGIRLRLLASRGHDFCSAPLMVSSALNLNPRFVRQTLIRSLLVFILRDSKQSRMQAFELTLCQRPRNFLSHLRTI
jgi:hypothetical protein